MSNSTFVPLNVPDLVSSTSFELKVPNEYFNNALMTSFILTNHNTCKWVSIGDDSLGGIRRFELAGLNELQTVTIGKRSFTYAKYSDTVTSTTKTDGVYRIINCPKLKSIQIGDYSFSDYHSFELNYLPSLRSISIGDDCFYWVPSISIIGFVRFVDFNS